MPITVNDKVSVEVENFNGMFSIKEGWINREGEFKPNFCRKKFGKDAPEKTAVVSVRIGDAGTAPAVLRELYREITGGKDIDDDAPF